ncbi:transmembrane protein [Cystoisospora suis]|uniref:Transmembrane protein n=1 Tax=Cystoisospora suis TaxID=483139 RepID=A0A2C6L4C1_9APIC|nr:transmembrane protein [Cystoisospora suis]
MGKCRRLFPSGGYENPAVGSWGTVVAAEGVIILLLVLLSQVANLPLKEVENATMPYVSKQLFLGCACVHAVGGLIVTALCFAGYLFSSCFLIPLGVVGVVMQILCLATSGLLGSMFTQLSQFRSDVLDDIKRGGQLPVQDFSVVFVGQHEGMIVTICVLCLVVPVLIGTACSQTASTPGYEATVYPGAIMASLVSAGLFLFCRANPALAGLSIFWLICGVGLGVSWGIQKACCSRILSIVLAVIFLVVTVFSLISAGYIFGLYLRGKEVLMDVQAVAKSSAIQKLTEERYEDFKTYVIANFGVFLVAGLLANFYALVFTLFAGLAAIRSACGRQPTRKSTSISQDDADDTKREQDQA